MRIVIERDGRSVTAEVAPGLDAVEIDGQRYPVTVVRTSVFTVELEIGGEKALVEQWPEHFPDPPGPVDVNGERWTVRVERPAGASSTPRTIPAPASPPLASPAAATAPPGGTAIAPPMPGKVIEVRVQDGDRVRKGDILLVLEAMKMRNEIASPRDGVVRGLRVRAGANARAKETMLFVTPD